MLASAEAMRKNNDYTTVKHKPKQKQHDLMQPKTKTMFTLHARTTAHAYAAEGHTIQIRSLKRNKKEDKHSTVARYTKETKETLALDIN